MWRTLAVSLGLAACFPGAALATVPTPVHVRQYLRAYHVVRSQDGPRVAGCNLIERRGSCHVRASDAEVTKSLGVLDRVLSPPAPPAARYITTRSGRYSHGAPVVRQASARYAPASGGSSSGGYCGAYQFDQSTWSSVGMSGSPCGASPAQQDAAAQALYRSRGSEPWPNCGHLIPDWAALRQCENSGSYH